MNTINDFDRRAAAWLADGPTELSDRVLDAALREVHLTNQRRRWSAPWRTSLMSLRLGLAAAVALIVIGLGGALYIGGGGPAPTTGPTPTAVSSPAPTPAPTPSRAPGPFTSPLYGYTVDVPAGWAITPTLVRWPAGADPNPDLFAAGVEQRPDFDSVYIAAQPVPAGMTSAAWQLAYAQLVAASGRDCKGPVDAWTDAVVGSLTIRRLELECQGLHFTDVAFVVDGTGYVMSGNRVVIAHFLDTFQPGA